MHLMHDTDTVGLVPISAGMQEVLLHDAGVIADTKQMKRRAWQKVAQEEGLRVPSDEQLEKVADMRLERAITEVLRWSQDWSRAKDLAWRVASAYGDEFANATEPQPGVREWLHVLSKVNVPCAVVSTFDR
jgi:beta-phosphoglucomutase-like phosphatase (HAD superfamily)